MELALAYRSNGVRSVLHTSLQQPLYMNHNKFLSEEDFNRGHGVVTKSFTRHYSR